MTDPPSTPTMPLPASALPATGEATRPARLRKGHGFGTAPVFLASISTILGATPSSETLSSYRRVSESRSSKETVG